MIKDYLKEGMYLTTLDGTQFTNAIVVKIESGLVTILTDFGNIIYKTEEEVFELYKVSPSWIEANRWEMPLPSLEQRIDEQILNLQHAKEKLCDTERVGDLDD